jgi:competence protein ComEA
MKDWLRDLFTFSAGERKGIIALVLILIIVCGIQIIVMRRPPVPVAGTYPEWLKDSGILAESRVGHLQARDTLTDQLSAEQVMPIGKFYFDPNTATLGELLQQGISIRVCRTILSYRKKGGKFSKPEDLKKIYGLSPGMYSDLAEYIKIVPEGKTSRDRPSHAVERIELNRADSGMLEALPGIGPVLAKRLVKYRSLLGGYYSTMQIREVYGITDSLFNRIASRLDADTMLLTKLNVNAATEKELARHPYIGKFSAAGIIRYREHVTSISDINELVLNGLIPENKFEKLKKYLSL